MKVSTKKVHIRKDESSQRIRNAYTSNRSQLALLPQFTVFFMVLTGIMISIWYFWPHTSQAEESTSLRARIEQDIVLNFQQSLHLLTEEPVSDASTSDELSDQAITITLENTNCILDTGSRPTTLEEIFEAENGGWWIPKKTCPQNLIAIQITRIQNPEILQKYPSILAKKIDDVDTYALVYTTSKNNPLEVSELSKYVKNLTAPFYTDRFYFNTATAYAQKSIRGYTYYLDGSCSGGSSEQDPCKLWKWDDLTGEVTLLKKNVADTALGEANELTPGMSIDFARTQDYDDGINFIVQYTHTKELKLVRVQTKNNSLRVTSSLSLFPGEPNYSLYNR